MSFILLTFDSCRYDVMLEAATPVLDSYCPIVRAEAPATFTYASHQAIFVGILPNARENLPYYNRFTKQLIGLTNAGEGQVVKGALKRVTSSWNIVRALTDEGYQTVGAGAMNWFRQEALVTGFTRFLYTGTDADRQIAYLREQIDPSRPFFGFINFGETHAPYVSKDRPEPCPDDVRARRMQWPPVESGPTGRATRAFEWQMAAVSFLDARLPRLFDALPGGTVVVVTADHGECFGEDGYWGHGVNHPKVYEVPLAIFRLDRQPLPD
jgi:hypothetical protein